MKTILHTALSIALLGAFGSVHAQAGKTREQVRAELAQARLSGELHVGGESDLTWRELHPEHYPAAPAAAGRTREAVKAEVADAARRGELIAAGEGFRADELRPQRDAQGLNLAAVKTRAQVKAETLEAIRNGDVYASGEAQMRLNEQYPRRYAKAPAVYAADGRAQPDGIAAR
jgi:hypothetical protein